MLLQLYQRSGEKSVLQTYQLRDIVRVDQETAPNYTSSVSCNDTPARTDQVGDTDSAKRRQGWGATESLSLLVGMQNEVALWKTGWQFLIELIQLLPCDAPTLLLSIHPKELKIDVLAKTCTRMFTAPVVTMAKTWQQSRCPS